MTILMPLPKYCISRFWLHFMCKLNHFYQNLIGVLVKEREKHCTKGRRVVDEWVELY